MNALKLIDETRLNVSGYSVPKTINLRDGRLYWQPVMELRTVKPTGETFNEFLDLGEAPEGEILRFAKRWGILMLCREHGDPMSDPYHRRCHSWEDEPVSEYRRWSKIAGATLRIWENLNENKIADTRDWNILLDERFFVGEIDARQNLKWEKEPDKVKKESKKQAEILAEKLIMIFVLNRWLERGDVRPALTYHSNPILSLKTPSLFGALSVSLLEAAGNHTIAGCSACHKFYAPSRKPQAGRDRYCPDCQAKGIPIARAKQAKALRDRAQKEKRASKAG